MDSSNPKLFVLMAALILMVANNARSQDTTSFTVDSFFSNPVDLTYERDAHVPSGYTFLRLNRLDDLGNPRNNSVGRVLYSYPVRFWDRWTARQATFETTLRFSIRPSSYGAADGLVFFIAPVGYTIPSGSDGPNFGIFNSSGNASSVFAVEFDNWINGDRDPNYRHIGIDINSATSRATGRFDSATGQVVTARINYDANTRTISVVATSSGQSASISYVFNLRTILPEWVQVGVSSSTGRPSRNNGLHELQSWYFTSTLVLANAAVDDDALHVSA